MMNSKKKKMSKNTLQMHMKCKNNALQAPAKMLTCPQRVSTASGSALKYIGSSSGHTIPVAQRKME